MNRQVLAWSLVVVAACLLTFDLTVHAAVVGVPLRDRLGESLFSLPFAVMGALVVTHRAGNAVGWLFLAVGVGEPLAGAIQAYGLAGLVVAPGSYPGAVWVAWVHQWIWAPSVALVAIAIPSLFPTGRWPSRRARLIVLPVSIAVGSAVLGAAVAPGRMSLNDVDVAANPLGWAGAATLTDVADTIGLFGIVVCGLVSIAGLVRRAQRARGIERQQYRWVGAGFLAFVASLVLLVAVSVGDLWLASFFVPAWVADLLVGTGLATIPVALGVAVLRYRLYEIDRLISRVLAYTLVTVVLATLYALFVVLLQRLLSPLTGGSDLAVATATLAVVAVFGPLRRRTQGFVDRRFNRRRYDAAQVARSFAQRLRNELELTALCEELAGTVRGAVQPTQLSLWLREGAR
ncbi:MAG: hypothetical protein M3N57_12960 [Actinomycetota bacterium]|nr:hypothetical protein [Actinomycetota bacterium]